MVQDVQKNISSPLLPSLDLGWFGLGWAGLGCPIDCFLLYKKISIKGWKKGCKKI